MIRKLIEFVMVYISYYCNVSKGIGYLFNVSIVDDSLDYIFDFSITSTSLDYLYLLTL